MISKNSHGLSGSNLKKYIKFAKKKVFLQVVLGSHCIIFTVKNNMCLYVQVSKLYANIYTYV